VKILEPVITFQIENRADNSHTTKLYFFTLPGQSVVVKNNGKPVNVNRTGERELVAELDIVGTQNTVVVQMSK
jgi:hypothetical protein